MSRNSRGVWNSTPVLVPIDHGGPRVRVGDETLRFGRDPICNIVIPDLTVSRRHARLAWDAEDLVLEDVGSSGGTFLNGHKVQRSVVRPGDVIRLGPRVEYRADVEATTSTLERVAQQEGEDGGVRQLQTLLEVAQALNAATVLDEVLEIVLQAAVRLMSAGRGYLVLRGGGWGTGAVVAHPRGTSESAWAAQSSVLERAMSERRTIVVGTPTVSRSQSMVARGVFSAVAAPLIVTHRPMGGAQEASFIASSEVIGGILVERDSEGSAFSESALGVFESLAADAALAIDSARLYREAREKAKIEHEMALARTIQTALLREPPQLGFAEVFAVSQPARSVGGDLHHTAERPDGSLAFALGDVSGKGVGAALIMAMAQGQLGLLNDLGLPFPELLHVLDHALSRYNPGNRFLTLAIGVVRPDGHLLMVNAGHCPVVVVRNEGVTELVPATGPVLGLLDEVSWAVWECDLRPGETVVAYSDGVSESFSPDEREFGLEGVVEATLAVAGCSPEEVGREILDRASEHRHGREADDDVTLLILRYCG